MSNSVGGNQQTAGAVAFGGHNNAAPAQFTVGEIGFGPCWHDDEPSLRQMYERACQSIVRLECEADELRAEVALLREEQAILRGKLEAAANG
jgi:hypothetical protein